jgi:hypothetical protein
MDHGEVDDLGQSRARRISRGVRSALAACVPACLLQLDSAHRQLLKAVHHHLQPSTDEAVVFEREAAEARLELAKHYRI